MSDNTLAYFLNLNQIKRRDAAEVKWSHAVNSRSRLSQALAGEQLVFYLDLDFETFY